MSVKTETTELLQDLAQGGGPVLEALARMNTGALDVVGIDERTAQLVRFSALVGMDASPVSYMVNLALADEAGVDIATLKAVLATLAPLVGSARVVSAATKALQGIELANSR
jgi:alkylhydroperoxidase/carboxymuconolactone decarboxylase family protein YurZ